MAGELVPINLGRTLPGAVWRGEDGKIYMVERASATHSPAVFEVTGTTFLQVSDAALAAVANLPIAGATDPDGTIYLTTQGDAILVGSVLVAPPPPPPPPPGETPDVADAAHGLVLVELALGVGTFDVPLETDWVSFSQMYEDITTNAGRSSERDRTTAGTADVVMQDRDRILDPTNVDGPYFGQLTPLTHIRFREPGYPIWQGFVEDFGQSWRGRPIRGIGSTLVTLHCVDAFELFGADVTSHHEAILEDSPGLYFRLNEAPGATTVLNYGSVVDTGIGVPNGFALLVDPAQAQLGYLPGPLASSSAVEFDGGVSAVGLHQGGIIRSAPDAWYSQAFDFYAHFRTLTDDDGIACMAEMMGTAQGLSHEARTAWKLTANADGSVTFGWTWAQAFRSTTSPAGLLTTDDWHETGLSVDEDVMSWYRDGLLFGTSPLPAGMQEAQDPFDLGDLTLGSVFTGTVQGPQMDGRLSCFAAFPTPMSAGRMVAHARARAETIPEGEAATQLNAILDALGWPPGQRLLDVGGPIMAELVPSGPALDMMLRVGEDSGRGLVQMTRDGKVRYVTHDNLPTVSVAVFGDADGELNYSDLELDEPILWLKNNITVTREGGVPQVAIDADSVEHYGDRPLPLTGLTFADDDESAALAAELLFQYKDPKSRARTMVVAPGSIQALLQQVLARSIHGDRITVKRRPSGGGDPQVFEVLIEGMSHHIVPFGKPPWQTTFKLALPPDSGAWILGVSAIGIDTRMGA